ncbi:hypothetical protein L5515_019425 [Caenorhabditis briggsae]|uniref:DUF7747 domain-containing protein n=1 Tax=Caenorhabditis briggsae TaxID=6238 RepID=A0AAE9FE85_CAEBR|nr:hypothetical protein L5515_019425 [Caenorhabditis briggsae]
MHFEISDGKENPEQLYGRALQTDGNLLVSGKQGRMLESLVYETNWKLERCPRIHKRILCTLHLQSKSGNFCIIYIYSDNGPIPKVIKEEEVKAQIPIQDLVGDFINVLKWISNSTLVMYIGLLNCSTPPHPPMVVNSHAYASFVDGSEMVPNVILYDAFSP